jgi:ESCRT-I complex subunit TSG101
MADPVEFLTNALSQTGADALPYAEHQKWTLRQHLADLLSEFRTLHPSVQTYTQVDGRAVKLLRAQGTLPMYHQGHKYNIPVAVWLPERYPSQAPQLFVEPTPDMMISTNHAFVDASGGVRSSYIASWDASRSNLVDMAHDTSIQFGEAPPLFARPPG